AGAVAAAVGGQESGVRKAAGLAHEKKRPVGSLPPSNPPTGPAPPRRSVCAPGLRPQSFYSRPQPFGGLTMRKSFRPQLETLEDRARPSGMLSINDVAHVNHIAGQTAFVFSVSLSQSSNQPVSVNYNTADGTATAAEGDYVPTAGTLNFTKGHSAQTIT